MKNLKVHIILLCLFVMIFIVIMRCKKEKEKSIIFKSAKTNVAIDIDGKMDKVICSKKE
ncbi:hypothetical protein [Polaribacter staleyi]|uniref:hypothetical protein n=1 Tax=Polaribacter staleyi TaxID=2022337 RepID=UPI0031BB4531